MRVLPVRKGRARLLAQLALLGALSPLGAPGTAPLTPTAAAAEPPSAPAVRFVFALLNREYHNEAPEMAPLAQGPLTIQLASPSNAVTLVSHALTLTPLGDGSHRAELEVEFFGRGTLVADVGFGGGTTRLEDELTVPEQRHRLEGRVRLDRSPDGYLFTALELPETVEVAIESRLAKSLLGTCRAFAVLPLVALDCDRLEGNLSTAVIPLPPPGRTFLLAVGLLGADERAALDHFVAAGPGAAR